MKVPQHPNIALAIEALENSNSDAAWHLLRAIPKFVEMPFVGLTDDEQIQEIAAQTLFPIEFARAIEAKLKEKNT